MCHLPPPHTHSCCLFRKSCPSGAVTAAGPHVCGPSGGLVQAFEGLAPRTSLAHWEWLREGLNDKVFPEQSTLGLRTRA